MDKGILKLQEEILKFGGYRFPEDIRTLINENSAILKSYPEKIPIDSATSPIIQIFSAIIGNPKTVKLSSNLVSLFCDAISQNLFKSDALISVLSTISTFSEQVEEIETALKFLPFYSSLLPKHFLEIRILQILFSSTFSFLIHPAEIVSSTAFASSQQMISHFFNYVFTETPQLNSKEIEDINSIINIKFEKPLFSIAYLILYDLSAQLFDKPLIWLHLPKLPLTILFKLWELIIKTHYEIIQSQPMMLDIIESSALMPIVDLSELSFLVSLNQFYLQSLPSLSISLFSYFLQCSQSSEFLLPSIIYFRSLFFCSPSFIYQFTHFCDTDGTLFDALLDCLDKISDDYVLSKSVNTPIKLSMAPLNITENCFNNKTLLESVPFEISLSIIFALASVTFSPIEASKYQSDSFFKKENSADDVKQFPFNKQNLDENDIQNNENQTNSINNINQSNAINDKNQSNAINDKNQSNAINDKHQSNADSISDKNQSNLINDNINQIKSDLNDQHIHNSANSETPNRPTIKTVKTARHYSTVQRKQIYEDKDSTYQTIIKLTSSKLLTMLVKATRYADDESCVYIFNAYQQMINLYSYTSNQEGRALVLRILCGIAAKQRISKEEPIEIEQLSNTLLHKNKKGLCFQKKHQMSFDLLEHLLETNPRLYSRLFLRLFQTFSSNQSHIINPSFTLSLETCEVARLCSTVIKGNSFCINFVCSVLLLNKSRFLQIFKQTLPNLLPQFFDPKTEDSAFKLLSECLVKCYDQSTSDALLELVSDLISNNAVKSKYRLMLLLKLRNIVSNNSIVNDYILKSIHYYDDDTIEVSSSILNQICNFSLNTEQINEIIKIIFEYASQKVQINVALASLGLLWVVVPFIKTNSDFWKLILSNLIILFSDTRNDVAVCAVQTFFSLLSTNSSSLPKDIYAHLIRNCFMNQLMALAFISPNQWSVQQLILQEMCHCSISFFDSFASINEFKYSFWELIIAKHESFLACCHDQEINNNAFLFYEECFAFDQFDDQIRLLLTLSFESVVLNFLKREPSNSLVISNLGRFVYKCCVSQKLFLNEKLLNIWLNIVKNMLKYLNSEVCTNLSADYALKSFPALFPFNGENTANVEINEDKLMKAKSQSQLNSTKMKIKSVKSSDTSKLFDKKQEKSKKIKNNQPSNESNTPKQSNANLKPQKQINATSKTSQKPIDSKTVNLDSNKQGKMKIDKNSTKQTDNESNRLVDNPQNENANKGQLFGSIICKAFIEMIIDNIQICVRETIFGYLIQILNFPEIDKISVLIECKPLFYFENVEKYLIQLLTITDSIQIPSSTVTSIEFFDVLTDIANDELKTKKVTKTVAVLAVEKQINFVKSKSQSLTFNLKIWLKFCDPSSTNFSQEVSDVCYDVVLDNIKHLFDLLRSNEKKLILLLKFIYKAKSPPKKAGDVDNWHLVKLMPEIQSLQNDSRVKVAKIVNRIMKLITEK